MKNYSKSHVRSLRYKDNQHIFEKNRFDEFLANH
jgi:hypothetical protein